MQISIYDKIKKRQINYKNVTNIYNGEKLMRIDLKNILDMPLKPIILNKNLYQLQQIDEE